MKRDFDLVRDAAARGMNVMFLQMESTGSLYLDARRRRISPKLKQNSLSFTRHMTSFTQTRSAMYSLNYSDYLPELGTHAEPALHRAMPQPALLEVDAQRAAIETGVFHTGFLDYYQIRYHVQGQGGGEARRRTRDVPLGRAAGVQLGGCTRRRRSMR